MQMPNERQETRLTHLYNGKWKYLEGDEYCRKTLTVVQGSMLIYTMEYTMYSTDFHFHDICMTDI